MALAAGLAIWVQPVVPLGLLSSLKPVSLLALPVQVRLIWLVETAVILPPEGEARWLAEDGMDADTLEVLATPFRAGEMEAFAVSRIVNNARNDVVECVQPVRELEFGESSAPNSA